jgi:hypothetical protein
VLVLVLVLVIVIEAGVRRRDYDYDYEHEHELVTGTPTGESSRRANILLVSNTEGGVDSFPLKLGGNGRVGRQVN